MYKWFCSLLFLCFFLLLDAQKPVKRHLIQFVNKVDTSYSIHRPYEFLSAKAIERRRLAGISIDINDLPVSNQYLTEVKILGARIHNTSKWMNSAVIECSTEQLVQIQSLACIKNVKTIGKYRRKSVKMRQKNRQRDKKRTYKRNNNHYGKAFRQIDMLNGIPLHEKGFRGAGKLVAVIDGGFINIDIIPFFDSLISGGRLLPGKDFVHYDQYVNEYTRHGSQVLSTMAANIPGLMVGTAPQADYICLITEEKGSESPVEEENFIAALEYADSLGVDVINASIGYTKFDNAAFNYQLSDLDGETARSSIAADIAARKGMLVVISAGNSGNDPWKGLGVPADAEGVIAVGAVSKTKEKASFSSIGTNDSMIKPNVSALGQRAAVASIYTYKVSFSNGTSFAAPILCGMATSLWSAFPEATNTAIKDAIEQSAHLYEQPNFMLGNGIPDFEKAYQILLKKQYHSPKISLTKNCLVISIKNALGKVIYHQEIDHQKEIDLSQLASQGPIRVEMIEKDRVQQLFFYLH